ncbi:hypothetical protein HZY91_08610 [Facklamia sp. DSM 111018]|uniref:Uncharacterized protein n=1 Tax=Facklamia lactis TaxID=2749967 RepID=A0ABS0LS89_9LACT|nr:hypothetical protein [Facklamia lactis]MBG9981147.1 hypothetical protein [Facklamia lactis]MBG9986948.1 hypothetical protein [Facklamia lactis]
MTKLWTLLVSVVIVLSGAGSQVLAAESISDLPFEGYYLAPEDHAIEGLLFDENQLFIYLDEAFAEKAEGQERVAFLEEMHNFPHPDLKQYTDSVAELYLEEAQLDYDLKDIYQEITEKITPEMSQADVMDLINNRIPGIYYTEKNEFKYYLIASPSVEEVDDQWQITLFGKEIFTFDQQEDQAVLIDQDKVEYQFIPGFRP